MSRQRVGVLFGGRSGEHEVSIVSASSICARINRERWLPIPIRIEKDGRWMLAAREPSATSPSDVHASRSPDDRQVDPHSALAEGAVDVVFPVLHGPYGEDGTVQGLLELLGVPYVGAGVLGSAVAMDKAVTKTLLAAAGLPQVAYVTVTDAEWRRDSTGVGARIAEHLRYPLFVKPANLGSSVGISKVDAAAGLEPAMLEALSFDTKVVVEQGVPAAREIECAVLGNEDALASIPGEIIVTHRDGFYSYDAKYLDASGATTHIPAALSAEQTARVQRLSVESFRALELSGMARVDFFLDGAGTLYLNEVNTIPGFTAISMYPQMWEASGVPYAALIDRLLTLALARHAERLRLRTSRV